MASSACTNQSTQTFLRMREFDKDKRKQSSEQFKQATAKFASVTHTVCHTLVGTALQKQLHAISATVFCGNEQRRGSILPPSHGLSQPCRVKTRDDENKPLIATFEFSKYINPGSTSSHPNSRIYRMAREQNKQDFSIGKTKPEE